MLLFGRPTLRRTDISLKEYRNEQLTGSAPSGIQQRSRGVIPMRMNSSNSTGYQSPNDTKLYPCMCQAYKIVNSLDCINFTNYFTYRFGKLKMHCGVVIQGYNLFHADTDGQKIPLFQFIAKNYKSLGITWSIIADALRDIGYGDLSSVVRRKYCTSTCTFIYSITS